jgi:hypothetical protein
MLNMGAWAKGYLQYMKSLAILKELRDHSKFNQHTRICPQAWRT